MPEAAGRTPGARLWTGFNKLICLILQTEHSIAAILRQARPAGRRMSWKPQY